MIDRPVLLDQVFPAPAPVTLAGEAFEVRELRLRELAELQAWLRRAAGDPLEAADRAAPAARRDALIDAWHKLKSWPPALGTAEASALFGTGAGLAHFLLACLRTTRPGATEAEAAALAEWTTADEWARLVRVAWGIEPWQLIATELDPDWAAGQADDGEAPDWGERIVEMIREGWCSFAEAGELTLTQWRLLCSGGALGHYACPARPGESAEAHLARSAAVFARSGDDESGGSVAGP